MFKRERSIVDQVTVHRVVKHNHYGRAIPYELLVVVQAIEAGNRLVHLNHWVEFVDMDHMARENAKDVVLGRTFGAVGFFSLSQSVDKPRLARIAVREAEVAGNIAYHRLEVNRVVESVELRGWEKLVKVDLYFAVELAIGGSVREIVRFE